MNLKVTVEKGEDGYFVGPMFVAQKLLVSGKDPRRSVAGDT